MDNQTNAQKFLTGVSFRYDDGFSYKDSYWYQFKASSERFYGNVGYIKESSFATEEFGYLCNVGYIKANSVIVYTWLFDKKSEVEIFFDKMDFTSIGSEVSNG